MRRYRLRTALLWTILALSGLGLLIYAFSLKSNVMPWAVSLFLVVCLAVQVLLYRTAGAYMRELVCQLSDLIDQLTQLREDPVFPPLEDTILSRLQQQVERLASIWAGLNRQAKRDRDEIQSLVSDLSHQLKTPVATLQIYGSLLSQPELSPEQRQEYGSRMQLALERLDFLLDSMVKLSRLESGSIRLQPQASDVEELVLNAALQVRKAAAEKRIDVSIQPLQAPIAVCCDPKWTEEALFNILDNAVKYTPRKGDGWPLPWRHTRPTAASIFPILAAESRLRKSQRYFSAFTVAGEYRRWTELAWGFRWPGKSSRSRAVG